jgi:multiple sugar transport system substrate-binding protein
MRKKGSRVPALLFLVCLVLAFFPAAQSLAQGAKLTLWFTAGDVTATTMPFRDGSKPWAAFEAQNNCSVELVPVPYDVYYQKLFAGIAGGQAPDIAHISDAWMGSFIKINSLVSVPAADAKEWFAGVDPGNQALADWGGGTMYGYPSWGTNAYAITWNTDYFAQAGLDPKRPPQTLDELRDYAKKLAVRDGSGNLTRVGFAIRHAGAGVGISDKWDWLSVSSGVKYVDNFTNLRGGQAVFNTPSVQRAYQSVHDMIYVDKTTSTDFGDPRDLFLKGVAAMQISEVGTIQVRAPREAPNLKWSFAPPPAAVKGGKPSVNVATPMYCVIATSKQQPLALKAIKWFNNAENDYAQAAKYSTTPRWTANFARDQFASNPYVQSFKSLMQYGAPYPKHLAIQGVLEALGTGIQKVLHDEAKVPDALADAEKKANSAIQAAQ